MVVLFYEWELIGYGYEVISLVKGGSEYEVRCGLGWVFGGVKVGDGVSGIIGDLEEVFFEESILYI